MTKKERIAILTIFISVLGFAFIGAFRPLVDIESNDHQRGIISVTDSKGEKMNLRSISYGQEDVGYSKMVNMLSEVLSVSKDEVLLSLEGGYKPSDLLANSGIFLSDLSEEYSFNIVGESELVRFRA